MASLHGFGNGGLSIVSLVLVVAVIAAYSLLRIGKQRERVRRRAAWRAKRAEEERIWEERFGAK